MAEAASETARRRFRLTDCLFLGYLALELAAILWGQGRNESWYGQLALHGLMMIGIWYLVKRWNPSSFSVQKIRVLVRDWYPVLGILMIFVQLGPIVFAAHPSTYDDLLLKWDIWLFGAYAGSFFDAWASVGFTEFLRACWLSYFILPFWLGVSLYRRADKAPFHHCVFALMLGWLISFAGYFALPALGPGYFPKEIPAPQPVHADGATQSIAQALFSLEGKMPDVFPSGHTIIALLVLWLAFKNRVRGRFLIIPIIVGLLMGTMYLRYHYGVDVLAGALIAVFVSQVARFQKRFDSLR